MTISFTGQRTAVRAHVQTWRPYTVWYIGLVSLAGCALATGPVGPWQVAGAWLGPTVGWIGAHYVGDYFDRRLDAIGKPHRPIPSGRLGPRTALATGVGCLALAGCLGLLLNWRTVLLVLAAGAGVVLYSRVLKGRGLSGNTVRGLLGVLAFLFGAMTVAPRPTLDLLPFALAFLLHDMSSNLVGTLRDVDGDRAGRCRTLPVVRGVPFATRTATALYVAAVSVAAVAAAVTLGLDPGYGALLLAAAALGGRAFALIRPGLAPHSPRTYLRAHEILVVERLVLAGAIVALGAGLLPALAVLLPSLLATTVTQRRMRARHEFPAEQSSS